MFKSKSLACALGFGLALSLFQPLRSHAASGETALAGGRPRVGLVLSGGGARGLAHIGVLKVLEELHVPVDCIAGTSMGGVVGGVYASGMPLAEMEEQARRIDWSVAFQDRPDRRSMTTRRKGEESGYLALPEFGFRKGEVLMPAGVLYGQNMEMLFARLAVRSHGIDDLAELPIPFKAVATDIESGEAVVLGRGPLSLVMRATMSVPGVMAPVEIDGRALIDGGLVNNLPVDVARGMCGDVLIAVNLGTPLLKRAEIRSALMVGVQMVNILTEQNVRTSLASLKPSDVLISPQLGDISAGAFDRMDDSIAVGEAAARRVEGALRALAVSEPEYRAWRVAHLREEATDYAVDEVRIGPLKRVNPKVLAGDVGLKPGRVTGEEFASELNRIYETGDFEGVGLKMLRDGDRNIAMLEPREKSWGPDYLRFGISLSAQPGEGTAFNLVASHNQTWLNTLGGEWRNLLQLGQRTAFLSEFFQPIGTRSPFFIAPRVLLSDEDLRAYRGDVQVGQFARRQALAGLEGGVEIVPFAELRLGVLAGRERFVNSIGSFPAPSASRRLGAWTGRFDYDQLDNVNFPTAGQRLRLDVYAPRQALQAEQAFTRSQLDWTGAHSWGKDTYSAQVAFGHSNDDMLISDAFALGGFQTLSGYAQGRFRSRDMSFGRLGYQRVIKPPLGLELGGIISRMYAGGSLEAGHIGHSYDQLTPDGTYRSASLFIGAETLIGPVFLGFGQGEGDHRALWLSIGVPWSLR